MVSNSALCNSTPPLRLGDLGAFLLGKKLLGQSMAEGNQMKRYMEDNLNRIFQTEIHSFRVVGELIDLAIFIDRGPWHWTCMHVSELEESWGISS